MIKKIRQTALLASMLLCSIAWADSNMNQNPAINGYDANRKNS